MPLRFISWCDHVCLARLNAWGHHRAWGGVARVLAWVGTLEGCLLSWGVLSLLDARLAFPLVVSGMAGLVLFKAAKLLLRRPRPFERHGHVVAHAHPPDVYSFPSGHALHAGALGAIVALAHPALWLLGVAWALAMSASRVVLGLHYPSDVVAGAVLGAVLGAGAWFVQVMWWSGV